MNYEEQAIKSFQESVKDRSLIKGGLSQIDLGQIDFIHDSERLIKWVEVKDQKPKCNEKYSESEDVLCMDSNDRIFVAWYNSKLDQWFVSHFHASNKALSLDNVPVLWADISSLKNSRV